MSRLNSVFLVAVLFIGIAAAHSVKHECQHDKISTYIKQHMVDVDMEDHERHTASTTPRNFVITYDSAYMNTLAVSDANKIFKANVDKAIKLAIKFFSDLITIVPRTPYMIWTSSSTPPVTTCGLVTVPTADKQLGRDSDLHLYITYSNDPSSSYLAYAGWCRSLFKLGATHGTVNFNLAKLSTYQFSDPFQFQSLLAIVIHEMTHVLGFSSGDIGNWVNSAKVAYTAPKTTTSIRGLPTTILTTPNVLAFARNYYNCQSLAGMPLENQGGAGSLGSHWETTAINGEIMNAAISATQGSYSGFTIALLKDTGFYATVNASGTLAEPIGHGKGAGCGFVTGTCNFAANSEFCDTSAKSPCDFNGYAVSSCQSTAFTDAGCNVAQAFSNGKCYFPSNNYQNAPTYVTYLGVGFGNDSRCFKSSISNSSSVAPSEQGLCYKSVCNTAGTQITVSVAGKSLVCTSNNQLFVNPSGLFGKFYCPPNIAAYCGAKGFCPNQCSANGLCVNGSCRCLTGFKGTDCSTVG